MSTLSGPPSAPAATKGSSSNRTPTAITGLRFSRGWPGPTENASAPLISVASAEATSNLQESKAQAVPPFYNQWAPRILFGVPEVV